jgi:hypothetical protein
MIASGLAALALFWAPVPIATGAGYPAYESEPRSVADRCSHVARRDDAFVGSGRGQVCEDQLKYRKGEIEEMKAALDIACHRYGIFHDDRAAEYPEARRWMKGEADEIERLTAALRETAGPAIYPEQWYAVAPLLLMTTVLVGVMWQVGRHAALVGVRPPERVRDVGRPLAVIAVLTFLLAALVTYVESMDPQKTDFDWRSYCILPKSFWWAHALLLPLSVQLAAPLAIGWYITRSDHVPWPDPAKYRWGVHRYVTFTEIWSFATIALTGSLTAVWIRELAAAPSRTAKYVAWLGIGTVLVTSLLVVRMVRNGHLLRERYESKMEDRADRDTFPPDPTAAFLGDKWWKAPAALVVAIGLAHQVLTWAGFEALTR